MTTIKTDVDFSRRSAQEAKTHELLDAWALDARGIDHSYQRQTVARVFRACWSSALSVDQVEAIGSALNSFSVVGELEPMLKKFCRAQILRKRTVDGTTHYEVNY